MCPSSCRLSRNAEQMQSSLECRCLPVLGFPGSSRRNKEYCVRSIFLDDRLDVEVASGANAPQGTLKQS